MCLEVSSLERDLLDMVANFEVHDLLPSRLSGPISKLHAEEWCNGYLSRNTVSTFEASCESCSP